MYLLKAIVLGAILVGVSADMKCFQKEVTECQAKHIKENRDTPDICVNQVAAYKCMRDSARQCKTKFEKLAEKAYIAIVDVCTEGNHLYEKLKKDKKCGIKEFLDSGSCGDDFNKKISKVDGSDYVEVNKVLCKYLEPMAECIYKGIKHKCSHDTVDVFKVVSKITINLQKGICDDLKSRH